GVDFRVIDHLAIIERALDVMELCGLIRALPVDVADHGDPRIVALAGFGEIFRYGKAAAAAADNTDVDTVIRADDLVRNSRRGPGGHGGAGKTRRCAQR